jgi:hypothetical protein
MKDNTERQKKKTLHFKGTVINEGEMVGCILDEDDLATHN